MTSFREKKTNLYLAKKQVIITINVALTAVAVTIMTVTLQQLRHMCNGLIFCIYPS